MAPRGRRGRLVLIDCHSLIYRAFFALPPMSTSAGVVTNAVYGFTSMLAIVLASRPEYAIATFDMGKPTFRVQEYAAYKEGRKPMPDDLRVQFDLVRRVLMSLHIPIYGVEGFEADDLIGTLARQAEAAGLAVTIVSGDLDCLQLVSEQVEALVPRRGITDTTMYGPDQVRQRYNLEPSQLIDYKALRGDTSDNIPGVPGVGEKTASQLVQQFGSVEALLAGLDQLKPGRIRAALEAAGEQLALNKRMVTIHRDAPVELELERARWLRFNYDEARAVFDELEFRQLLARLPLPDQLPVQPTLSFEPVAETGVILAGPDDLQELRRRLAAAPQVAVYGLWDGSARSGPLAGLALAAGEDAWYVPTELVGDISAAVAAKPLAGHDVKETDLVLERFRLARYQWRSSTFLAAYLLGAGSRDPRLEDLAREFLGRQLKSQEEFLGTGRGARPAAACEPRECADFAGPRAQAVLHLGPQLESEMRNLGVDYLFHEVELPLAAVLARMERAGVAIDVPYLRSMQAELEEQLRGLETQVALAAGYNFNLSAPQQLAKLLFEDLRLPVGKRTKTGYSTDADTLEALREKHPVVDLILEHRQLSKLKSTYVDALPALVDPKTGRVHTSFGQAATATGRLSSSNPNLMNIPIRTGLGQRIRRAFQAGPEGWQLFAADYSQIELRIAAHLSEDANLLAAFKAGHDIHAATAARVFKVPLAEVSPDQRRLAKVANFGSIYGQGEYGLSQQMRIPGDEAREFLKEYWSTYTNLKAWLDQIRLKAREEGFVVSATGRRRTIGDLRSPNYQLRQAAERMAINFPIQSLAADIIKVAMVRLDEEIGAQGLSGRMLLQVHDELVFEVPEVELERFAEMVPRVMTEAYELSSHLEVEAKQGLNWADLAKLATVVG
ncbi:MAG: DNA polymerase I [Candidatus Dormibacter sp.]|uniref:DNA polymerase I n=1 Tax=Candidatus Dormibacter sp. TaxID=2973982 RepID=UPI000DB68D06|nr:MAG: DNA polymerase I [Candidatus Dormibacteraeota bacterium]